ARFFELPSDVATIDDFDLAFVDQLSHPRPHRVARAPSELHVGTRQRRKVRNEESLSRELRNVLLPALSKEGRRCGSNETDPQRRVAQQTGKPNHRREQNGRWTEASGADSTFILYAEGGLRHPAARVDFSHRRSSLLIERQKPRLSDNGRHRT